MADVKRLQIRRDTLADWVAVNPILLEGEVGLIIENGRISSLKIGDGVSSFVQLPQLTLLEAVFGGYVSRQDLSASLRDYATIQYVESEIDKILGGASGAYDTLKEIEDILKNDTTGLAALLKEIGTKADTSVVDALTSRVSQNESNIADHTNKITANTDNIDNTIRRVAANEADLEQLIQTVDKIYGEYVTISAIPTKTSQLIDDIGYALAVNIKALAGLDIVTKDYIADAAVTTSKVKDGAITSDKLSSAIQQQLSWIPSTTDNLAEGSSNFYFTNARAIAALSDTLKGYVTTLAFQDYAKQIQQNSTNITNLIKTVDKIYEEYVTLDKIPTKTSQLTNDSGFLTSQSLDGLLEDYAKKSGYSALKVLATDSSGNIVAHYVSTDKLGFLSNVTSDIQAQINALSIPDLDGYVTTETLTSSLNNLANTYLSFRGGGTVSGATTFSGGLSVQNSLTLLGVEVAAGSSGLTFDGKIPMYSGDAYTKSEADKEFHPLTTVDTAPTINSSNLVTSGGVAKAVADLAESADGLYQRKGSYLTSSSTLSSAKLDKNTINIAGTSVSLGESITQNQLIANLGLKGLAFKDSIDLSGYQPLITSTNKLAYSLISGTPTLAAVATSGSYNDLSNKPTIPSAITESTVSGWGFTKNAGTITGIKMNNVSKGTSGVVDLGTVLTSHQTIHSLTIKNSDESYSLTYTPNSSSLSITLGKSWVGLGNVENTKLSTWAGSANITTLGTITSGTWEGNKIGQSYLDLDGYLTSSIAESTYLKKEGGQITGNLLVSGAFILEDSFYIGTDASNYASIDEDGNGVFKSLKVGADSVALASDLSEYLPLSGGEAIRKGTTYIWAATGSDQPLGLSSEQDSVSLRFHNKHGNAWLVFYGATDEWRVSNLNWGTSYALIHSGNYSSYALPLSGGALKSSSLEVLSIKTTNSIQYPGIGFYNGDTRIGVLRLTGDKTAAIYDGSFNTVVSIITSGNIGSQTVANANKLGNINANNHVLRHAANLPYGKVLKVDVPSAANYLITIRGTNTDRQALVYVTGYGSGGTKDRISCRIITSNKNYSYYFNGASDSSCIYIKSIYTHSVDEVSIVSIGSYSIPTTTLLDTLPSDAVAADEDSNKMAVLSDTVASANKLSTARTIWGQSFDGSGDVSGDLSIGAHRILGRLGASVLDSRSEWVILGNDTATNGWPTYIDGNAVYLRYGTSHTTGFILNSSGNVGIGTTNPNTKLHVVGDTKIEGALSSYGITATTTAATDAAFTHYVGSTKLWWVSSYNNCANFNTALYVQSGSTPFKVATVNDLSSYLPKAGGTISGSLTFSATSGSHIIGNSDSEIIFQPSSDTSGANIPLKIAKTGSSTYTMYCEESEVYDLGTSSYKWNILYCRSASQSSDAALKNILGNVQLTTSQIANAPAVHFTWKNGGAKDVGTIAQYWKDVLPEVVSGEEGNYGMNYAVLGVVSSIILARNIETHEQRIARLEKEISDLQKELNALVNNE